MMTNDPDTHIAYFSAIGETNIKFCFFPRVDNFTKNVLFFTSAVEVTFVLTSVNIVFPNGNTLYTSYKVWYSLSSWDILCDKFSEKEGISMTKAHFPSNEFWIKFADEVSENFAWVPKRCSETGKLIWLSKYYKARNTKYGIHRSFSSVEYLNYKLKL